MKTERLERLSGRQLGALAMTAAEVPALRVCARLGWLWVLLGGLGAAAGLSALTVHRNRRVQQPMLRQRRAGRALWKTLLFALLVPAAAEAAASFPETARSPLAAALILLLAFWAARQGAEAAGRCAGILLWITGALCAVVLVFSLPGLHLAWLRPAGTPLDALIAFAALLIPGAALALSPALEAGERVPHWPWWGGTGLATAAALVAGGILSPALARRPEAFRTLARGVSVLGVIRRFEALVNAAMLMSGFCLCTLLLTVLLRPKARQ